MQRMFFGCLRPEWTLEPVSRHQKYRLRRFGCKYGAQVNIGKHSRLVWKIKVNIRNGPLKNAQERLSPSAFPASAGMDAGLINLRGWTSSQNPAVIFSCAGGHSGQPVHRGFVSIIGHIGTVNRVSISSITVGTNKRNNATPGGIWSGCAGSRTFQPPGVASKSTFGVCQGGNRPRWSSQTIRCQTGPS